MNRNRLALALARLGRRTGLRRSVLVAVSALALSGVLLPATSASAYSITTSSRPGGATVYAAQGLHYNACVGMPYACFNPDVFVPAPYITRSPASTGTQYVTIINTLFRWNGSAWAQAGTHQGSKVLAAGQSGMSLVSSEFTPKGFGYFKVTSFVQWSNASGATLGWRYNDLNQSGDYRCVGAFTASCNATPGYVYLRSP